jgi:integrase/recombinase XerD
MAKVYLLLQDWPARDRKCWATAIAEGDVLDGRGPASHWAPATKHINIHHYGRWLGYLATTNQLETGQKPDARVTPAAVRSYVKHLQASIAPVTVVSTLVGLKVMMKALAPDQEWRWLADFCNRLNRNAEPSRDKRSRMLPLGRIYGTAIEKLETLSKTDLTRRVQIVGFRNALMLALLAVCVLRVKNFASNQWTSTSLRGWFRSSKAILLKCGHA